MDEQYKIVPGNGPLIHSDLYGVGLNEGSNILKLHRTVRTLNELGWAYEQVLESTGVLADVEESYKLLLTDGVSGERAYRRLLKRGFKKLGELPFVIAKAGHGIRLRDGLTAAAEEDDLVMIPWEESQIRTLGPLGKRLYAEIIRDNIRKIDKKRDEHRSRAYAC